MIKREDVRARELRFRDDSYVEVEFYEVKDNTRRLLGVAGVSEDGVSIRVVDGEAMREVAEMGIIEKAVLTAKDNDAVREALQKELLKIERGEC